MSKGTKLYVCMLSYVPCQVITYLSVTQNLFCHEVFICYTRYYVTYCYTLQVCHVKYAICYIYFMSHNIHCHMLRHVKKCCMLHGTLYYEMLHVTCMTCYEMFSVTFMSRSMSCLSSYVHVTLCYVKISVFYVTFMLRHVTKCHVYQLSHSCQSRP